LLIGRFPTAQDGGSDRLPRGVAFGVCGKALCSWLTWLISVVAASEAACRHSSKMHLGCDKLGQSYLLLPLLFVQCGVCCCGAVAPRVTAALLGRFLPRLGPPAPARGPFFLSTRQSHPAVVPAKRTRPSARLRASSTRYGRVSAEPGPSIPEA